MYSTILEKKVTLVDFYKPEMLGIQFLTKYS